MQEAKMTRYYSNEPVLASAVSGEDGSFSFSDVKPGRYNLIFRQYNQPVIGSAVTGRNGLFSLSGVKPGRYYLILRHSVVVGIGVELRVKRARRKAGPERVEAVLRNDLSDACAGATITVVRKDETSIAREKTAKPPAE